MQRRGETYISISEYPWKDIELKRDCLCSNITEPFIIVTKTSSKVIVAFKVTKMKITEDYNNYFFDANCEYIPNESNCLNPWKTRRLRGSSVKRAISNIFVEFLWLLQIRLPDYTSI
ncbi:hypothetical protein NQ317_014628 [Molorchus minor]|uniref:Uncharacterized protein n=1 Tax=Molorchus minor TaxID=1323400 RepID=A0ABQ9J509_9CUCU|nr:hypothetical protein NQ317_014628 [Molorchus minor]